MNLGSGIEISIRDLASKICNKVGYEGQLIFDFEQTEWPAEEVS